MSLYTNSLDRLIETWDEILVIFKYSKELNKSEVLSQIDKFGDAGSTGNCYLFY
jgi:hypothetical protein